jgi:hypothetical protein
MRPERGERAPIDSGEFRGTDLPNKQVIVARTATLGTALGAASDLGKIRQQLQSQHENRDPRLRRSVRHGVSIVNRRERGEACRVPVLLGAVVASRWANEDRQ